MGEELVGMVWWSECVTDRDDPSPKTMREGVEGRTEASIPEDEAMGRGFLEQLHPGSRILAVQYCFKICATQLTFHMKISLFCFSHIKDVLKFKPLQRGKAFHLESRINLSEFFVKHKYTKNDFLH